MNNLHVLKVGDIGALLCDIPHDVMINLLNQTNKIKEDFSNAEKYNNSLVGHIENEYELAYDNDLDYFLNECIAEYDKHFPLYLKDYNVLFNDAPLGLHNLWVNFQKKYEFNPPHSHSGVFSFVIWMKIPYDLQEELGKFSNVHQGSKTSLFNFLYTDGLGNIKTYNIHVDKNFEGKICFFPSNLMHYVNPFYTSDNFRISISGNVKLQN